MKTLFKIYLTILIVSSFYSCKSGQGSGNTASDSTGVAGETFAVCIWDRAPLKETPEDKGKWLASLSLGEKCTFMDDEKEDNSAAKPVKYVKIKLQDGKEGWAQSDLVILNSRPAAFIQNTELYSRPDLLTKTGKLFSKMDIVAVKSTQNDFVEVTGKRKDGKWIESGWVKPTNLSYADVDIAVAKFACKALAIEDQAKRTEAINEIINNSDLKESVFINELSGIATADKELEETPVDTSDLTK